MTLTEIKYVVSLAHFKHFGEAAANCNVSQPTLSIAVKKLESALGIDLFERSQSSLCVAPLGEKISQQAQCVLDKASATTDIAKSGEHQLNSPLHIPSALGSVCSRTLFLHCNLPEITKI